MLLCGENWLPMRVLWPLPASLQARSWAYRDSLRAEENRKLQKMKDEQHQKSELLELKRQQQEEERAKVHQTEHRRVNNAFLDRLQGKSQPGGLEQSGGCWNMNSGNSWVLCEEWKHAAIKTPVLVNLMPDGWCGGGQISWSQTPGLKLSSTSGSQSAGITGMRHHVEFHFPLIYFFCVHCV
ncbi:epithelial-stromal interaction protein 1 isoform X15 [Macaca fascicularis]|uniref:epithelial-stromal interaction protein 1 isoform X15 n=1 Tax=Macaca fascicularis TaxID=9541 RepID=UPI003D15D735